MSRAERNLEIYHQRANIHDGLKHLSDRELILKVRESPTKLKRAADGFLKKLRKHGVELTEDGEVDLSQVGNEAVRKSLAENLDLVKVTLMH